MGWSMGQTSGVLVALPLRRTMDVSTQPSTKGKTMKEEMRAITERLDQMEGALLAHQVYLTALGSEIQKLEWAALMELAQLAEKRLDQLRPSPASDLTLQSFQKTMRELQQKLHESDTSGPFWEALK